MPLRDHAQHSITRDTLLLQVQTILRVSKSTEDPQIPLRSVMSSLNIKVYHPTATVPSPLLGSNPDTQASAHSLLMIQRTSKATPTRTIGLPLLPQALRNPQPISLLFAIVRSPRYRSLLPSQLRIIQLLLLLIQRRPQLASIPMQMAQMPLFLAH